MVHPTVDQVVPSTATDGLLGEATLEDVLALATEQLVVREQRRLHPAFDRDVVRARSPPQTIRISLPIQHEVWTPSCADPVSTRPAVHGVGATSAADPIVPAFALDQIGAARTDDHIVAGRPDQASVTRQRCGSAEAGRGGAHRTGYEERAQQREQDRDRRTRRYVHRAPPKREWRYREQEPRGSCQWLSFLHFGVGEEDWYGGG
jgi:hypothetical protein